MIGFLEILVVLAALYIVIIVAFTVGVGIVTPRTEAIKTVSVLISAHNEADRIGTCLSAIANQTYDSGKTEVIVVDDRSTDGTGEEVLGFQDRIPNLNLVTVTELNLVCPKKNALASGLEAATGEIILTTDADCTPSLGWIASTVASFSDQTGMVIGPAPLTSTGSALSPLLVFQSLLVNALAAGSAGIGIPLTCSGRNLAYRRSAYDEVGGYAPIGNIIGGDDVLLMRRIRGLGWSVVYNQDRAAEVPSAAHTDRQWSRQVRYQSKIKHYGLPILSVAMLVYIFHLLLLVAPPWAIYAPHTIPILVSVLILKAGADGVFLWRAARRLGYLRILRWFPLIELLAVPYISVFSALGTFRRPSWT